MKKIIFWAGIAAWCFGWAFFGNSFAKKSTEKTKAVSATVVTRKGEYTDPNTMIQATPDKSIVVLKIKSNPTTGYSWFLNHYDSELLTPISQEYIPSKSELVGAGGYVEWKFKVNEKAFTVPQLTKISLEYIRPWVVAESTQKLDFTIAIEPTLAVKPDAKK